MVARRKFRGADQGLMASELGSAVGSTRKLRSALLCPPSFGSGCPLGAGRVDCRGDLLAPVIWQAPILSGRPELTNLGERVSSAGHTRAFVAGFGFSPSFGLGVIRAYN